MKATRKPGRFLTLRPFGDLLCTPGTRAWLAAATTAVAIMAGSEAVSWGYIGLWFTEGPVRYLTATGIGVAVFLIIVVVDSLFLTFDLHPQRYEISKVDSPPAPNSTWQRIWHGLVWIWKSPIPGFLVRLAMVLGSLWLSSRYLTSAVLSADVTAQIERQDQRTINEGAARIATPYDRRIAVLQQQIDTFRKTSFDEAAGTGPSRKRGRGPAVLTAETRLTDLQRELAEVRQQRQADIEKYRREAQSAATVASGRGGLQERAAALKQLEQSPGFKESQLPIKGYLLGVFLTIVLLKIFQRKPVAIYFSDRLQDAHGAYLEGRFDQWVPVGVRSTDQHRMSPLDFEDWYQTSLKPRLQQLEFETHVGRVKDQHVTFADMLDQRSKVASLELLPLEDAIADIDRQLLEIADNFTACNAEITSLQTALQANRSWIADMNSNLAELDRQNTTAQAVGADVYVGALRSRNYYISKVSEMETQLKTATTKCAILEKDRSDLEQERQRRQARLDQKRAYLKAAEAEQNAERLDELRQLAELRKRYDPVR